MLIRDLFEAPLADISFHGDEKNSAFTDREIAVMKKHIKDDTYHVQLRGVPFSLYIYVLHRKELAELGKIFPEGEIKISGRQLWHNIPEITRPLRDAPFAKELVDRILEVWNSEPMSVQFIMGDNYAGETAGARVPPTPWIMAHRLAHCMPDLGKLLTFVREYESAFLDATVLDSNGDDNYNRGRAKDFDKRAFIPHVGRLLNIKSFSTGRLVNDNEIPAEIATRYLLSGRIERDVAEIQNLGLSRFDAHVLDVNAKAFVSSINSLMKESVDDTVGKVFYI